MAEWTPGRHLEEPYKSFLKELLYWDSCKYLGDLGTLQQFLRAKCMTYAPKFVERFPELRTEKGFIRMPHNRFWNPYSPGTEHIWCVTLEGKVVDPTLDQFHSDSIVLAGAIYTPFDPEAHIIQIGRCANCGSYIYGLEMEGPKSICDDVLNEDGGVEESCSQEYDRYIAREAASFRRGT